MQASRLMLIAILVLPSCATLERLTGRGAGFGEYRIERDEWGVPTIRGASDAAVAFGLGYAQAEDNVRQLEEDVLRAIGRAANLYGEAELANDLIAAAFEIPRLAQEEYQREPDERRRIWDAFTAGINHYLVEHPAAHMRVFGQFEPWHLFALTRAVTPGTHVDGVVLGDADATARPLPAGATTIARHDTTVSAIRFTSVALAIAPDRSDRGHALLLHVLDRSFYGAGQPYEAHLRSAAGWHVSGHATLGTPVIRAGHGPVHAWAHTDSGSDTHDAFALRFDHPTDSLAYRWNGGWRQAEPFTDTIAVNTAAGVVLRPYTFLRTVHGPIVLRLDRGQAVAVRIARMREGGMLQQWYEMNRAASLDAFRAALARTALVGLNTMYADTAGNIYYVHGSAVPRRAAGTDASGLLDAADPSAAWDGYHALNELPELLNPASGWIQSGSGTPFLATAAGYNLDRDDYPSRMAPEGDTPRALRLRELQDNDAWTLDALVAAAMDVQVSAAARMVRRLIDEYEQRGAMDPSGVLPIDRAVSELRAWDGSASVASHEMMLFVTWQERVRSRIDREEAWPLTSALAWAVDRIQREWQDSDVEWGRANLLERAGAAADAEGVALPGGPPWTGTLFGAEPVAPGHGGRRVLVSGHAWSSVVELAPQPRSRSAVIFGQSADPASPHFFDQARLIAEGRMKPAVDPEGQASRTGDGPR